MSLWRNCAAIYYNTHTCVRQFVSFEHRSLFELQSYLCIVLISGVFTIILELLVAFKLVLNGETTPLAISIATLIAIAITLSVFNCICTMWLLYSPSKSLCIYTFMSLLAADVVYNVQFFLNEATSRKVQNLNYVFVPMEVVAIFFEIYALTVVYRYWDYIVFNLDSPSRDNSDLSSRMSSSSEIKSPLRIEDQFIEKIEDGAE